MTEQQQQISDALSVTQRVTSASGWSVSPEQRRKTHTHGAKVSAKFAVTMSRRYRALLRFSLLLLLLEPADAAAAVEYSSTKTDLDYEFGDYRGKWCIDDHGFVYAIGEVYYPSPSGCPCTCTVDGPVCIRPKCPRIHPRCTRIRYKACCPVCEAVARVCVYGGKTYRLLEEFRVRRCRTVCTSHTHTRTKL